MKELLLFAFFGVIAVLVTEGLGLLCSAAKADWNNSNDQQTTEAINIGLTCLVVAVLLVMTIW